MDCRSFGKASTHLEYSAVFAGGKLMIFVYGSLR